MALTGTDLLMNANLFKLAFPNWPGVSRSQALVPDESRRCECGHFAGECDCAHACSPRGTDSYFAQISIKGRADR